MKTETIVKQAEEIPGCKKHRKIRVGFVTPSLAMGGAERWMLSLAKHCDPSQIEWVGTVVTPHGPVITALTSQMIQFMPIYGTDVSGNPKDVITCDSQASAMQHLKDWADVLITWGIGGVGAYTGLLDCPLVFVSHGTGEWTFDALQSSRSQCTHFIAVSKAAAAALSEGMPVIENGIETDRCQPSVTRKEFRNNWNIPPNATVVAYIGRYSDEKNPIAIAQAVKHIDEDDLIALYCGEGHREKELVSDATKILGNKVIFIPFQEQIGDVLNAIDVFVLASETEGFSLALTEAWYAGVPAVVTRVGAVPDLEYRFGKLVAAVPVNPSPQDVANAINDALSDRFQINVIPKAKRMVEENFTAEIMGRKWTDCIKQIANETPRIKVKAVRRNLAIVSSVFGSPKSNQRIENFQKFRKGLGSIPFYVVEASFNNQFVIPDALRINCYSKKQLPWQKERMLNLLVEKLPPEIDYVAWVDSDILFHNPDWYQQTILALETNPIVQMWSSARFQNKDGSFNRMFQSCGKEGGYWGITPKTHCGFAWAMRREVWDQVGGLFDLDIVGGGDSWMAHAFFGERSGNFLRQSSRAMLMEFAKYYERCQEVIKGNVGCVTGDIAHMYHGDWEDRKYWERHLIMRDCKYNPTVDLTTGENGLHEWTGQNPDLINRVSAMLQAGHYEKELAISR